MWFWGVGLRMGDVGSINCFRLARWETLVHNTRVAVAVAVAVAVRFEFGVWVWVWGLGFGFGFVPWYIHVFCLCGLHVI